MENLCLGEVETVGFTTAVEAADVAVKTANVELLGFELANGGGLVTIKLKGQVWAVRAAVTAAVEAASRIGTVQSSLIIPRPSEQLGPLVTSAETIGLSPAPIAPPVAPATAAPATAAPATATPAEVAPTATAPAEAAPAEAAPAEAPPAPPTPVRVSPRKSARSKTTPPRQTGPATTKE